METRWKLVPALAALTAILAPAVYAQEEVAEAAAPPPMFWVYTEYVDLADAHAYETEIAGVLERMRATEEGKKLNFTTFSGPEIGYVYVQQMAGLGDFDRITQEWGAAVAAVGGPQVWDKAAEVVDRGSAAIFVLREDLSYTPAEPRAAEKDGQVRWWNWWYAKTASVSQLEDVARAFKKLYEEKKVDTGWRVYQAMSGPDLPLYLVSNTATSPEDYHTNNVRIDELLGDEDDKLTAQGLSFARRVESSWGRLRPDLSITP